MTRTLDAFRLDGRVGIVTGGAGVLGAQHVAAIADAGGVPVIWDLSEARARDAARLAAEARGVRCLGMDVDVTSSSSIEDGIRRVIAEVGRVDVLINNAANDPKMGKSGPIQLSRVENFPDEVWEADLAVGLKGAFNCSRAIGPRMAAQGGGVILNIASDLALISPDQRLYREAGLDEAQQPVKPVTYSVVKHGLIGLTRYLATYWASSGVRVNALSPGGIFTGQDESFVRRLSALIPMGRMSRAGEYQAAVLFLISDASSYVTGTNVVIDGGRTTW